MKTNRLQKKKEKIKTKPLLRITQLRLLTKTNGGWDNI